MNEIGAAWVLGKPIIAIMDKLSPMEMPDIIKQNKAIDLNDFEDTYLVELLRRVKRK